MTITRVALALVLLSGAAGCSGSSNNATPNPTPAPSQGTPTSTAAAGGGTVHDLRALAGNRWSTGTLALKVGDTVKVTDTDPDVPHNFIVAGVGQSSTMNSGQVFSLRFDKAGTFDFVCSFHKSQGMEGTITVS